MIKKPWRLRGSLPILSAALCRYQQQADNEKGR
jgi:hypothetical protein